MWDCDVAVELQNWISNVLGSQNDQQDRLMLTPSMPGKL